MMACDYMLRDDFYEEYLLNRIDADEKKTFEIHLRTCGECRSKLAAEEKLLNGLRVSGKKELMLEIQRQAELYHKQKEKTDWTLFIKVAAVLFFLVLMPGILYMINQQYKADSRLETDQVYFQRQSAPMTGDSDSSKMLSKSKIINSKYESGAGRELSTTGTGAAVSEEKQLVPTESKTIEGIRKPAKSSPVSKENTLDNAFQNTRKNTDKDLDNVASRDDHETESMDEINTPESISKKDILRTEQARVADKLQPLSELKSESPSGTLRDTEVEKSVEMGEVSAKAEPVAENNNHTQLITDGVNMPGQNRIKPQTADTQKSMMKSFGQNQQINGIVIKVDGKTGVASIVTQTTVPTAGKYRSQEIPDSFRVEIVKETSKETIMRLGLTPDASLLQSANIHIDSDTDSIYIHFNNDVVYKIDLKKDKLWAVRQKDN